ncbi:hypothetical protein ACRCJN_10010, partial [Aerococcus urinaeequi]|uniref:hypothetical protein n=1 Tax=Aerococcus urinaeequi TaxID=51665 RepID=UPI003D6B2765
SITFTKFEKKQLAISNQLHTVTLHKHIVSQIMIFCDKLKWINKTPLGGRKMKNICVILDWL